MPVYQDCGRPPTLKQPPAGWQHLQFVKHRDAHGRLLSVELRVIFGEPDAVLALFGQSTAYIERTHLTMRLFNGGLVRQTLGFSKDLACYPLRPPGKMRLTTGCVCSKRCGRPSLLNPAAAGSPARRPWPPD